jgi:hypothetical protein
MSGSEVEPANDTLPVSPADLGLGNTGMEDFETSDMVMPRLAIKQEESVFVDNLTGEEFPKLQVVLLGLIKQRILWDKEVNEGDRPLCKSYDFRQGHPDRENFPLRASGFDSLPQEGGTLPCDACALKEWDTHPNRSAPWCAETHTFPLMMPDADGDHIAPAVLTVQRSALRASKQYLTAFARSSTPLFTVVTEMTLDPQKKGSVKYSVPRFKKIGDTDSDRWQEFADHYRSIRTFITTPPPEEASDDAERTSSPGVSNAPVDDDDLPF